MKNTTISIAWRNIRRNKARSLVIMISVAIGVAGAVLADGFMEGMSEQRIRSAISNEISNIQIHNPQFLLNKETEFTIAGADGIVEKIKSLQEVKGISRRFITNGMASSAEAGAMVSILGISPDTESQVSSLSQHIVGGKYLAEAQRLPVFIGEKLSKKLNLNIDDKLILTFTNRDGEITSGAFNITGIYKTTNDNFDKTEVFVKNDELKRLAGYPSGTVNEIAILLKSNELTSSTVRKLDGLLAPQIKEGKLIVQSWKELAPVVKSMSDTMNFFSMLFLMVILIALAFAIINTMLMSIMERTREFGMLTALGMNKRKIFEMILSETLFLSIFGAAAGLILSALGIQYFSAAGFDLSSVAGGMNSIGYDSVIYPDVKFTFYATAMAMVIIIAVLSSLWPAAKAMRLRPAEAIRENE
ncbi:MAG: FtsX-like permease family protein [Bacteroidales bacterium]|jgi:ABC-type lipoprotein release transport system permease subunit|nr:FtsX-like permease family protein [Bacteroidales bacterium]